MEYAHAWSPKYENIFSDVCSETEKRTFDIIIPLDLASWNMGSRLPIRNRIEESTQTRMSVNGKCALENNMKKLLIPVYRDFPVADPKKKNSIWGEAMICSKDHQRLLMEVSYIYYKMYWGRGRDTEAPLIRHCFR